MKNTYPAYRQQSIMTMTTGDMLTTLYDGALKELGLAELAFERQDWPEVNRGLKEVTGFITELRDAYIQADRQTRAKEA